MNANLSGMKWQIINYNQLIMKRINSSNNTIEFCKNDFCVKTTGRSAEFLTEVFIITLVCIAISKLAKLN